MQLKAKVPALPVLAKGGQPFGDSMSVGTHQPADMQHTAVEEADGGGFLEQSVQQLEKYRECLMALPNP